MVDALCLDDLDAYGRELDAPLDELWQDLYHRLFERPGSNVDDPDRGIGLEDLLSAGFDPAAGAPSQLIAGRIRSDFLKDDRVKDAQASLSVGADGQVTGAIQIVADEGVLGVTLSFFGGVVTVTRTS